MKRKAPPPSRKPTYRSALNILRMVDLLSSSDGCMTLEHIARSLEISTKSVERYLGVLKDYYGERLVVTRKQELRNWTAGPLAYRIGERRMDEPDTFNWRAYRDRMPRKLGA